MLQTFKNAWKIPDLRKKMIFTLIIVLIYRIGVAIYVPFVNVEAISTTTSLSNGLFGMINLFSGGSFEQATLFALSVSPYITASIVMQLLTIAIPALERLSKEGEEGKKKINKITRIVTMLLALITSYGYVKLLDANNLLNISHNVTRGAAKGKFLWIQLYHHTHTYSALNGGTVTLDVDKKFYFPYYFQMLVMIACFCAGAAIIMWLAERINERGIGNGISIILFANIISRGGRMVTELRNLLLDTNSTNYAVTAPFKKGSELAIGLVEVISFIVVFIAVIGLIVWFTNSERRIPIQYAKRVVGRKMYGGQSSNLPLKLNMAGVMPIIFASSIVSILPTIAGFFSTTDANGKAIGTNGFSKFVLKYLSSGTSIYIAAFIILIIAFSYFYIMISFNPIEVANNIRSNGGSIPGIRPGKPTSDYIKKILNRITTLGAIFLIVVAGIPMIIGAALPDFATLATFGGSSLLIVVGVALETTHDIEAQMTMRNYKGFLD